MEKVNKKSLTKDKNQINSCPKIQKV